MGIRFKIIMSAEVTGKMIVDVVLVVLTRFLQDLFTRFKFARLGWGA